MRRTPRLGAGGFDLEDRAVADAGVPAHAGHDLPAVVAPPAPGAAESDLPVPVRVDRQGGRLLLTVDVSGRPDIRALRVAGTARTIPASDLRPRFLLRPGVRAVTIDAAGDDGHFVRVAVVRLTGAGPARADSPPADSAGHPAADPGHPSSTAAVTMPTHLTPDHVTRDAFPTMTPRHGVSLPGHTGATPPGHSAAAATHFSGRVGMPAAHAPSAAPMETPGTVGHMPTNAPGGRHVEEGTDWFDDGLAELWEGPLQEPHDRSVRPWQTHPAPPDSAGFEDAAPVPTVGEPVGPIPPVIDLPWPVVDTPGASTLPASDGFIVLGGVAVTTFLLLTAGVIDRWNMQVGARASRDDRPRMPSRYFRGSPILDGPTSPRPELEQAPGHVAAHSL